MATVFSEKSLPGPTVGPSLSLRALARSSPSDAGLKTFQVLDIKAHPKKSHHWAKINSYCWIHQKKTKNVFDSYLLSCSTPSFTHLLSDMWVLRRGDMCHTKLLCQAQASEMRRGQEAGAICWLSATICYNLLQCATATLCEATILLLASVKTHTGMDG